MLICRQRLLSLCGWNEIEPRMLTFLLGWAPIWLPTGTGSSSHSWALDLEAPNCPKELLPTSLHLLPAQATLF